MSKSTFFILIFVYSVYLSDIRSCPGVFAQFNGGGSIHIGGGSNGGSVGGSLEDTIGGVWSSSELSDTIERLINFIRGLIKIPITLALRIFDIARSMSWDVIKLNIHAITLPITGLKDSISIGWSVVSTFITRFINDARSIGSFNEELVELIVTRIRGVIAWLVRTLASGDIYGIQFVNDRIRWVQARVQEIIAFFLKLDVRGLYQIGNIIGGAINISHIRDILHLPVIRQIVDFSERIHGWNQQQIYKALVSFGDFVLSIIKEHKDFFIPIFHRILNAFEALAAAWKKFMDGGEFTGVSATIGNFHIALGPLVSGSWVITGLGNKTIGEGCLYSGGDQSDGKPSGNGISGNTSKGGGSASNSTSYELSSESSQGGGYFPLNDVLRTWGGFLTGEDGSSDKEAPSEKGEISKGEDGGNNDDKKDQGIWYGSDNLSLSGRSGSGDYSSSGDDKDKSSGEKGGSSNGGLSGNDRSSIESESSEFNGDATDKTSGHWSGGKVKKSRKRRHASLLRNV